MRQFGLIGYPLSHSFSEKFFTEKFRKAGIGDCRYSLYPLPDIGELPALIRGLEGLEGLNVTIPHKAAVIPYLWETVGAATRIGAVNCIHFTAEGPLGYNTDAVGFARSLQPLLQPWHDRALVLGTGGAARAVTYALEQLGIAYRQVSRRPSAEGLVYEDLSAGRLRDWQLIINTTPLGMHPQVEQAPPLPYAALGERHLLYDLVYNPAETVFLAEGRARGAAVKNGYEMLVLQAEASWEIWNGHPAAAELP